MIAILGFFLVSAGVGIFLGTTTAAGVFLIGTGGYLVLGRVIKGMSPDKPNHTHGIKLVHVGEDDLDEMSKILETAINDHRAKHQRSEP